MILWITILKLGGEGNSEGARQLLEEELPLALRNYASSSTTRYVGPVPKAVARFARQLSARDQARLRSYQLELVDYIVDETVRSVEESLFLVELCRHQPELLIYELATSFPWKTGLKRSVDWKREQIADLWKLRRPSSILRI